MDTAAAPFPSDRISFDQVKAGLKKTRFERRILFDELELEKINGGKKVKNEKTLTPEDVRQALVSSRTEAARRTEMAKSSLDDRRTARRSKLKR